MLSLSFIVLSAVLLILGNQLLKDSRDHIIEQRLVIAQMVANQIDRSLTTIIDDLELTAQRADFDPLDTNLDDESEVMVAIYTDSGLPILQLAMLDTIGNVVVAYPPGQNFSGADLPDIANVDDALDGKRAIVSIPWQDSTNENLLITITIPIIDGNRLQSWLSSVVDLDEASIKASLIDAATQDKTAHAILVDSQGRSLVSTFDLPFLSPGEHHTFYSRAMTAGVPVVEEVLFELDLPDEPPGHHHIMAFVPLKVAPWGISVGGDVIRETFAAPYRLFLWLASFFVISLIGIWGITMFSTKRLLEPAEKTGLKFDISRQIAKAKDWEELTSLIVRIPSAFMPVSDTRLLVPDDHGGVKVASEWTSGADSLPCPSLTQTAQVCETCAMARESLAISLAPCTNQTKISSSQQLKSFCFPLVHMDTLVGTLHFCVPLAVSITDSQKEILASVASDMAFALENAQLQKLNLKHAEMTQAEQKRIFRRLHDTIGQNISFLHLKLDQYSDMDTLISMVDIQEDIIRMRETANQAYEQMRDMLADLNPDTLTDLVAALRSRIATVSERAKFGFEFTIEGEPSNVPQRIKRHVLFICYEALNNIERHAQAENVLTNLIWESESLTITITDDGIGLDRSEISVQEHYGLSIMEDRAQMINGKLSIVSSPKTGMKMTLWVPL